MSFNFPYRHSKRCTSILLVYNKSTNCIVKVICTQKERNVFARSFIKYCMVLIIREKFFDKTKKKLAIFKQLNRLICIAV